jgi:acyl-CoA reductase-like NAD-dependent aldehyde dehydrogenase
MSQHYKMYLGGEWVDRPNTITVTNPYDDSVAGSVASAAPEDFVGAIDAAHRAFELTRELPVYRREAICRLIADRLEVRAEEFSRMMTMELGKAIKDSRVEVARAIALFRTSAEEAKRIGGELIDLDWTSGNEGRLGLLRRFPRGVIGAITPFNFPLNLVAHKIGPAIASGNTMVLKPASKTPIIALMLAEIIAETDYPLGAISILPASAKAAAPLLEDSRVKMITFTGSAEIGWWIKSNAGQKPAILELGGNAGAIVADDANLEFAAKRLLFGSFASAGQSCISVQRIYAHEHIYDALVKLLTEKTATLRAGDPMDPATDIGALVDTEAVQRTTLWIDEARRAGAKLLCGGTAKGRVMTPAILTDVTRDMSVCSKEIFAPVVTIQKYKTFVEAVAAVNDSDFGLQAGVFTNRMSDIMYAFKRIETGGVVINDVPTWRADHMPYGGVKGSGIGREGVRYAIEDMTEPKLLALNMP